MSVVQSILFDSKMWDVREAVRWLQENEFKASKIDETVNFYRFRQDFPFSTRAVIGKPHIISKKDTE